MRQRLTWKNAENNDVYTMNQTRVDPGQTYQGPDDNPSGWAEDPDMSTPWKSEKRDEVGKAASVKRMAAYRAYMDKKASKCLVIAEALLPGASDTDIQAQATELLDLPDQTVLATLARIRRAEEQLLKAEEAALAELEKADEKEEAKDASESAKVAEAVAAPSKVAEDITKDTPAETPTEAVVSAEVPVDEVPAPMVDDKADVMKESADSEDPEEDCSMEAADDDAAPVMPEEDMDAVEAADEDADFDVDFDNADDDSEDDATTASQEAKLAVLFGSDLPQKKASTKTASTKNAPKGVKKLGGSVKTASVSKDKVDLSSLWMNKPDCHDVSGNF